MADVVARIIVEYYLIRARADYDGLLLRLVIRRHIAIEFLLGTYHLCAKQSFTCYVTFAAGSISLLLSAAST